MAKDDFLVGLDLGNKKISVAIGKPDKSGTFVIMGHGSAPTRGFQNGLVIDMAHLTDSISQAVERAESVAGQRIHSVFANISGDHLKSFDARAAIMLSDRETEIKRRDVSKVLEAAKNLAIPYDRRSVHIFELGYVVDSQGGITNPVGMYGSKLEVELHLVTALAGLTQNISKSLNHAGLEVEDLSISSVATSLIMLTELEKDIGVVFIDIREDTTEVVLFTEGRPKYTHIFPLGSFNLAASIAKQYKTSFEEAEQIIKKYASLDPGQIKPDEKLIVRSSTGQHTISRMQLYESVSPKVKEMLKKIDTELKNSRYINEVSAGIVMTGDIVLIDGMLEMAEEVFNLPVKMGLARNVSFAHKEANTIAYATAIGLLRYGADVRRQKSKPKMPINKNLFGRVVSKTKEIFEDYF